ncbi:hypothetical protein HYQ45_012937 [Verticillium longisporum]|uniref:Pectate lyase n=1 Tax=Verticillium longisporum TaxID=100787 RepID=A0A8I2ZEY8_VERLO|nr:hypothetical protein HYQ45_012937 [Verticillium longisporum]
MRFITVAAVLASGVFAAPSSEILENRDELGYGSEIDGYVYSANITLEQIEGLDLSLYPDIFKPAVDLDPEATEVFLAQLESRNIEARAGVTTKVNIGTTRIDYGCDASIRTTISNGIRALCHNGWCDFGKKYSRKVKWTNGGAIHERNIEVRADGHYTGKNTRHYLQEAALKTINGDTAKPERRCFQIGNQWGLLQDVQVFKCHSG